MEGGVVIEYYQSKWEDVDLGEIAKLTKRVFEIDERGEYSFEQIERHLVTLNERFPFEAIFVAYQESEMIGWIGIERQTENIGEIGRWHPYVTDIPKRDEVAASLISEVMNFATLNGMNRLEISFGSITDDVVDAYNRRRSWLEALDWSLVEDTLFMDTVASKEIPELPIPDGYELHPLLESGDDALYSCHYAAFTSSEAREFYGLTEDERRQHFNRLYDRNQPINSEASFVLKHDDEIIAILLIISREDEDHISVVAVHPKYRGQGLAKAILATGIKQIQQQGVTNISIGVDGVNTPAVQLYSKFGFEVKSRLSFFSWSRKD